MASYTFKATSHRIITADIIIDAKNEEEAYEKYYDMSQRDWDNVDWKDTHEIDTDRAHRYDVLVEEN